MTRLRWIWLPLLALTAAPEGARAMCSGGPGRPRVPLGRLREYPVDEVPAPSAPANRYAVGDYSGWWQINRDDILLSVKSTAGDPLEGYARKGQAQPDKVEDLLSLVGYEGDFCTIVREIGLRRLRRHPDVGATLIALLKDPKSLPQVRTWAAAVLGDVRHRPAIPALVEGLEAVDVDLRGFCAAALGGMEDAEAAKAALDAARSPTENEDLRCMTVLSLAGSALPEVRAALQDLARKDASLPVRRAALMALGVKAGDEDSALLVSAAEDKEPHVREAALIGLGFSGKGQDVVVRRIRLKTEADPGVRSCAALALGMLGDPASVPDLAEAVEKEKDVNVKGCAALALGRCPSPKALEALVKASAARHAEFLQTYAAIGLGLTGKPEALPTLVAGLESKQFDVITASAAGIALLGLPEAAKPLLKSLENRRHEIIREYSAVALGRLRAPEGYPKLLACLEDKSPAVRHATGLALAVYGDPAACPALEKAIGDKQEPVRMTASIAFDLLTADEARPLTLADRFRADPRNRTSRKVGTAEIRRLLNRHAPPGFKLPLGP